MSTRVSSQPNCPLPTDNPEYVMFLNQFLNDIPGNAPAAKVTASANPQQPPMSMEQPPEQPMIDSLSFAFPDSAQIVKQEMQSGFLDVLGLEGEVEHYPDRFSPQEKKSYSSVVKEELYCKIKLKLLSEGKDIGYEVTDNQTAPKEYPISEETKELQRVRREKNREAAKKCRQKKKSSEQEQEDKIREAERQIRELKLQLNQSQNEYTGLLDNFKNFPCFMAYLRQNRQLLTQPAMKQELKRYVETHGGQFNSSGHHRCCVCPRAVAVVAPQPSTTTAVAPHFHVPF